MRIYLKQMHFKIRREEVNETEKARTKSQKISF